MTGSFRIWYVFAYDVSNRHKVCFTVCPKQVLANLKWDYFVCFLDTLHNEMCHCFVRLYARRHWNGICNSIKSFVNMVHVMILSTHKEAVREIFWKTNKQNRFSEAVELIRNGYYLREFNTLNILSTHLNIDQHVVMIMRYGLKWTDTSLHILAVTLLP